MKKILSKTIALLAICAVLFSFAPPKKSVRTKPGGEGFEILLNDKLLVQRFGSNMDNTATLSLSSASTTDKLVIKYHHCGQVGKKRVITIKDDQNKILKEFKYNDDGKPVLGIHVPVKDILDLKKGNTVLKLYYSSAELPNGRMLASINTGRQTV